MTTSATLQGPIAGASTMLVGQFNLGAQGYLVEEYFLSGAALSYHPAGPRNDDGRWEVTPATTAPFTTRILVCRPSDPSAFDGTVVVEWLNVSAGSDGAPEWMMLHRHLMRERMAWVGVSVQAAGIEGGGLANLAPPLKQADSRRYGSLSHPGDAFSFDILTQAGRAIRESQGAGVLGPLSAQRIIAAGASQSAIFLVTYVNAIDRNAKVFDAFLVHGRGGVGAPMGGDFLAARRNATLPDTGPYFSGGERIREDVRVPVITIQSETDLILLGGIGARQPDSDRFRLWEVAGAAHFDAYGLFTSQLDDGTLSAERMAQLGAPTTNVMGMPADSPINAGPQFHYVFQAALDAIDRWVRDGRPAPSAPRMERADDEPPRLAVDELGNVRGGIRTPWVDVPVAALSGLGQSGAAFAALFGTTRPFDDATLTALYPGGRREYLTKFEASTDDAARAGFILDADVAEIKALAAAACPME